MRNGTQEELDAAREDATKLPMNALFRTRSDLDYSHFYPMPKGAVTYREGGSGRLDNVDSVQFVIGDDSTWYVSASDLEVIA